MVAAIINRKRLFRAAVITLLACLATVFTSCASKSPPPLISDPTAANETALPWNQQQKWEREGQAAGLTQESRR
jgi:predicted ATPase